MLKDLKPQPLPNIIEWPRSISSTLYPLFCNAFAVKSTRPWWRIFPVVDRRISVVVFNKQWFTLRPVRHSVIAPSRWRSFEELSSFPINPSNVDFTSFSASQFRQIFCHISFDGTPRRIQRLTSLFSSSKMKSNPWPLLFLSSPPLQAFLALSFVEMSHIFLGYLSILGCVCPHAFYDVRVEVFSFLRRKSKKAWEKK